MNPNKDTFLSYGSSHAQANPPPPSSTHDASSTASNDTVQTQGSTPRTIHVAHRRSPSELTTLMLEQLNLQRQLEIVQAQQQQIIQQQQHLSQQSQGAGLSGSISAAGAAGATLGMQSLSLANSTKRFGRQHRRSSSSIDGHPSASMTASGVASLPQQPGTGATAAAGSGPESIYANNSLNNSRFHRRTQSSVSSYQQQALGHSRRHSLGLAEARRAAAEAQAQRTYSPSKLGPNAKSASTAAPSTASGSVGPVPSLTVTPSLGPPPGLAPPSFKFPPSPTGAGAGGNRFSHGRSASALPTTGAGGAPASPQRFFQFPPRASDASKEAGSGSSFGSPQRRLLQPGQQQSQQNQQQLHTPAASESGWRRSVDLSGFQQPFMQGHHRKQGSSYGGSTSSMAQFQQNGQRKSLFAPYLPQSSLPELINEGRLVTGTLRVNKKNRSDAYVSTDGLLDADIFICGSKDRNRALEGDLVAVELLVVDEVWSSKREKEEKKRRKDRGSSPASSATPAASADDHNDASAQTPPPGTKPGSASNANGSLNRRGSLKQRPTQKKNDDVEVEGQSLLLVEEEQINDQQKPLYAGHIVAVIDRIPGQLFSGTLGLLRPSQASKENKKGDNANSNGRNNNNRSRPKIVWFKPTDKKVPLIAIPTEQAPRDFVENHDKYNDKIFVASIKRWPITSLHPFGTLVSQIGSMDDPKVEVLSILRDNNFQGDEYPTDRTAERFLAELPRLADGVASRRDLTGEYVLAFSPDTKVSDVAMHVKVVSNSRIELGVHVADVSYYVRKDSGLDKRARKRSHGVVLPQQTVGLLPDNVSEQVSFKADGGATLALSVVFEIDSGTFEVADVWMGETVVRPAQLVSYAEVDRLVNKEAASNGSETPDSAVAGYVATLELISARLRQRRLGSSDTWTPLLSQLDDERVRPQLNIYESEPAACLLGEIFHAVNSAVAQKIHAGLGTRALLRRFSMPTVSKFEAHLAKIARLGVKLDTSSAASFQNSILSIADPVTRECVETILVKCMPRGRYVVAGQTDQSLGHYLFNSPTYTHFTCPLRRYADLVVHRQLKAVLSGAGAAAAAYTDTEESLKVTCDYCNFKKDCARAAQDQAVHLLACQVVNDMGRENGQVLCTGVVLQVYESSFDVLLPEFGIEKRVHGDQLPLRKAEFNKADRVLELYWEPGADSATYVPEDENDALSYRASIRNKYRAPAAQAASAGAQGRQLLSPEMSQRLQQMHLKAPQVKPPQPGVAKERSLESYLSLCKTRVVGDDHIQEIRVLQRLPVLLRAEIGMALPCFTVRTLNPFGPH